MKNLIAGPRKLDTVYTEIAILSCWKEQLFLRSPSGPAVATVWLMYNYSAKNFGSCSSLSICLPAAWCQAETLDWGVGQQSHTISFGFIAFWFSVVFWCSPLRDFSWGRLSAHHETLQHIMKVFLEASSSPQFQHYLLLPVWVSASSVLLSVFLLASSSLHWYLLSQISTYVSPGSVCVGEYNACIYFSIILKDSWKCF